MNDNVFENEPDNTDTQSSQGDNKSEFNSIFELSASILNSYKTDSITKSIQSLEEKYSSLTKNIKEAQQVASKLISQEFLNNIVEKINIFQTQIGKWLQSIDYSDWLRKFSEILQALEAADFSFEPIFEQYFLCMYNSKWFPYAGMSLSIDFINSVFDVVDHTKDSKNRIKKIDKVVFNYYSEEIPLIKKSWKSIDIEPYEKRILCQSLNAFNRKEYALTICTLASLWESFIQQKAKKCSYRTSSKIKEQLSDLIKENNYSEIFSSFANEFIFYDCKNKEEVKPDVPGRHSFAHGWYDRYPSKKAALNAIIFTDFLLQLNPIENEENQNG